jgi:hypothetical protein
MSQGGGSYSERAYDGAIGDSWELYFFANKYPNHSKLLLAG